MLTHYRALLVVGLFALVPGCLVAFDDWSAAEGGASGFGGDGEDTGGRSAASGGTGAGQQNGLGGEAEADAGSATVGGPLPGVGGTAGAAASSGGTLGAGAATGEGGAAGRPHDDGGADAGLGGMLEMGAGGDAGAGAASSSGSGGASGAGAGQGGESDTNGGNAGGAGGAGEPRQLSLGKPVLSDSQQEGNPAANANDGRLNTRWTAGDGNVDHWWRVDLSENHQLARLDITWEFDDRLYGYVVEVSPDDAAWTPVIDNTNNPSREQDQSVALEATGRFLRIRLTALDQSILTWASITEATVFGR